MIIREKRILNEKELDIRSVINDIRKQIDDRGESVSSRYLASPYYEKRMSEMRQYRNIVIVGAGVFGLRLYEMLIAEGIVERVCAVCDNSKERQIVNPFPKDVISVERAVEDYPKALFVITPRFFENELFRQLIGLGIGPEQIMIYTFAYTGLVD